MHHLIARLSLALALSVAALGCGGMEQHGMLPDETEATFHRGHSAVGNNGQIAITYELDRVLPVRGLNLATAVVTFADGATLVDPSVHAHLYMPAHGHGSTEEPIVTPLGNGKYRIENIVCTMAGEWQLTVHAMKDGVDDKATFILDVP